jgi:uncharacterized repeat protein (TIGR02543 family)
VYTVSFETNGGNALDTQSVPEGQTARRPADPVKPDFGFVDWYDNEKLNEPPYNFDTPVSGDLTLYAKWGDPCTVTFMDGDSVFDTKIVGEGGRVSRPADPVKPGYVFGNWYCDLELTVLYDFDTPVSGDMILYAKWVEAIDNIAVTVTGPMKGAVPDYTASGTGHYTVGPVSWTPDDSSFQGSTRYTATVTLTADTGSMFTNSLAATINGNAAAVSGNTGTTVTLAYAFAETSPKAITALAIKAQPPLLTYTHGDTLDLSGLVVTLTYDDTTTEDAALADFAGKNISANPAHGAALSFTNHNGKPVEVKLGNLSAYTGILKVDRAIPVISFPTASPISYGAALSSSILSGGTTALGSFVWQNPSTVPLADGGYPVVFTPDDAVNYDYSAVQGWNGATALRDVDITLILQTPAAADYTFGKLTQIEESVTAVIITANTGKSNGAITIYYNGGTTVPQAAGTYAVTFDVAAAAGWNAASGLSAGTLTVETIYGTTTITLTVEAITEATAGELLPSSITISRGAASPVTVTVSVTGAYSSITWEIDGVGAYLGQTVTSTSPSFTLDGADVRYNTLGGHIVRLTVVKDGKTYQVNIPFTVIN